MAVYFRTYFSIEEMINLITPWRADGIERNGGWGIQLAMKQKCHEKCSYHNFSMDLSMRHFMGQNVGEYKLSTDEALIGAADGAS